MVPNIEYPVLVIGPVHPRDCSFCKSDDLRFVTTIEFVERRSVEWRKES